MKTFEEIEVDAAKTLRDAGVFGIFPVPLETVAGNLGFKTVAFKGKPDVAGAIHYENKTIYVNGDDCVERQRFTLAHEIGHAVLHPQESVMDFRRQMDPPRDRKEIEANNFAANLLMPKDAFSEVWAKAPDKVVMAASYFAVSPSAAKYRASNLGL